MGAGGESGTREALTVTLLCVCWYTVSSGSNVLGKIVLLEFPYPLTVTMVQLLSLVLYSGPAFRYMGVRPLRTTDLPPRYTLRFLVPLATAKFFTTVFSHVSIWKVPVSYAHTVKATMPLFTVVLSWLLVGERQSLKVYLSLVPIISGVAVATVTELSYNLTGLVCALSSTALISLQHIYSKQVMRETGVHHLRLLQILGKYAFFMFLPVWLLTDLWTLFMQAHTEAGVWRITGLLALDGALGWLQNVIAFSVLSMVTPLTYAVASAAKRIAVIAASLFLLRNPVTSLNVLGMCMAILGVLAYNKAKYDQRKSEKTVLPVHNNNGYQKLTQVPLDINLMSVRPMLYV